MRLFKINGKKFNIVNRYTGNFEINNNNQKYDLIVFDTSYNAWKRVCSCMTISEGKKFAENYVVNPSVML